MVRNIALVAILSVSVIACSQASDLKPTQAEINRVEALLSNHRCVGDLSKWRRTYVYMVDYSDAELAAAKREGRPMRPVFHDTRLIEFVLQRAGGDIKPGRISATDYPDWIQSDREAQPEHLFGGYAIPLKQLNLECENPPAP